MSEFAFRASRRLAFGSRLQDAAGISGLAKGGFYEGNCSRHFSRRFDRCHIRRLQLRSSDSRMTGAPYWCSSGMNCMQDRYNAATKAAKAKAQNAKEDAIAV
jgi:hypothetical protein